MKLSVETDYRSLLGRFAECDYVKDLLAYRGEFSSYLIRGRNKSHYDVVHNIYELASTLNELSAETAKINCCIAFYLRSRVFTARQHSLLC